MTDVTPQQIATILINDWTKVVKDHELEIDDVPAYIIRQCIDRYIDETVSKTNMIKLFEYYARRAVEAKSMTAEELVEELIKRHNETPEVRKERIING